jgi:peptidoglycan/LPS O-acetylase OafA/YrhL
VADPKGSRLAHLDGLRAVLLLGVMAHHLEATFKGWVQPVFKAGWLPVDGFFVLSGMLITTALLREHAATGTIRVARYQLRRLVRIYPALLVVLAAIAVLAVGVDRRSLGDVLPSVSSAASGVHNYNFRRVSPLLGEVGPLWSLSVELQFYVVFPVVAAALLIWRAPRRLWVVLLAAVIAASAAGRSALGVERFPDPYLWTHVRLDSLAWGVLVAIAVDWGWLGRIGPHTGRLLVAAAGATLFVMYFSLSGLDAATYRWGIAVAGPASAVVVCHLLLRPGGRLAATLALRPVAALGRRSFAAYLWHQPVFLLLARHVGGAAWTRSFAGFAATFALADLTHRLVEIPTLSRFHKGSGADLHPNACGKRGSGDGGHLLGDAVDAAAAVGEHRADVEADHLAAGILLGDDRQHVAIGRVPAHGHDDDAVGGVEVEVGHGDALAIDLGERQHRDLDDLDRLAAGVSSAAGAAHVDVGAQPVLLRFVRAPLHEQRAGAGEGGKVVDVAVGVVVEGEAVRQPDDRRDPELVS